MGHGFSGLGRVRSLGERLEERPAHAPCAELEVAVIEAGEGEVGGFAFAVPLADGGERGVVAHGRRVVVHQQRRSSSFSVMRTRPTIATTATSVMLKVDDDGSTSALSPVIEASTADEEDGQKDEGGEHLGHRLRVLRGARSFHGGADRCRLRLRPRAGQKPVEGHAEDVSQLDRSGAACAAAPLDQRSVCLVETCELAEFAKREIVRVAAKPLEALGKDHAAYVATGYELSQGLTVAALVVIST